MKPKISDSTLNKLWRKAVMVRWHSVCVMCGTAGTLEAHHIIGRRYKLLRWERMNGVALCSYCHRKAHTPEGQQYIYNIVDIARINEIAKKTYLQYLSEVGITDREYKVRASQELKNYINNFKED